jgi:hypothetical protein
MHPLRSCDRGFLLCRRREGSVSSRQLDTWAIRCLKPQDPKDAGQASRSSYNCPEDRGLAACRSKDHASRIRRNPPVESERGHGGREIHTQLQVLNRTPIHIGTKMSSGTLCKSCCTIPIVWNADHRQFHWLSVEHSSAV